MISVQFMHRVFSGNITVPQVNEVHPVKLEYYPTKAQLKEILLKALLAKAEENEGIAQLREELQ